MEVDVDGEDQAGIEDLFHDDIPYGHRYHGHGTPGQQRVTD
jgi:hypothetical protein